MAYGPDRDELDIISYSRNAPKDNTIASDVS